jgi:replicative DNA helicase
MAKNEMHSLIEELMNDPELSGIFDDPVVFSKAVLGINPRWYQKKILRDKNLKKVARWGRRSGKTLGMVLYMIWRAFVQPDGKDERLLVIGPYGIQVDTIFDELRKLIQNSPILQASVTRSVQSPQRIEFGNGSMIIGLSAGSGSGKGASSIRGQGATYIFLDETDYLTEGDINSIMGMQLEDMESIGIWCSSTPTGQRKMFWEWCTYASKTYTVDDKELWLQTKDIDRCENYIERDDNLANGWVQYHYPSWVNPKWSDDMDKELKAMFSAQGYVHEVDADFGDATTGVYNKSKLDDSKYDYTYEEMRQRSPMPQRVRIIASDWDKYGAATEIVVSEYDEENKKIRVIERAEIPSTEYTFDNAVKKIQELNNFWKPDKIYLDRGYGEYQVEVLKKSIGKDIVKGIAFNSKIEVLDPADNTIDKKETKHFMITQAQILLERDQLMFSAHDDLLVKQMENYQVVKRSSVGKPIYTSENEHAHDAFVLTVLAFNQEFPDITKLLEKRRKATIMAKVNKRLESVKEKLQFNNDRNKTKKQRQLEKELEGEPEYVKHMKSIEYGNFRKSNNTWGSRGTQRRPPGRKNL